MRVPFLRGRFLTRTPYRPSRVIIDAVFPSVDGGRYPAKAASGDLVPVRAHIFADGHDLIRAVVRYRAASEEAEWREAPLLEAGNDEWEAEFVAGAPGSMEFTVQAWIDRFGSWRADLVKRLDAGWDVSSELLDGAELLARWANKTATSAGHAADLEKAAARLTETWRPYHDRTAAALDPELLVLAHEADPREGDSKYRRLKLTVERERARFSAWYEFFPRSAGTDPDRGATLAEAAARLPDIASLGFDVVYLPPVHPIGHTERKGPNNTLNAAPSDPGSPWAIGSEAGGHTAVHPELGTLDDFDQFVAAAADHGLEVALDLALQCSPDHPWVTEHPEWFKHRPDGSIRYAENPPKQYQDIYPLDFETADWAALWLEVRHVVDHWIEHGVRIFRVDNPHTKPFRFWQWLIAGVREEHPDVIFLAEAFTRPKRMQSLAKLGFSQSYSYFTWRNTKSEIEEYFTELSSPPLRDYLRPNLFVNTPDILHAYLQRGGRPAFLVRLVLAATLGPSYGIYSGYELIENVAEGPESEEYHDSEKYQLKPRDRSAPGNIRAEITRMNTLRRQYRALQHNHGLWFLPANDPQTVAYVKTAPDSTTPVVTVVNLDVTKAVDAWFGLPLQALGLPAEGAFRAHDVLNDRQLIWSGEWNHVQLDPATMPAAVFVFPDTSGTGGTG